MASGGHPPLDGRSVQGSQAPWARNWSSAVHETQPGVTSALAKSVTPSSVRWMKVAVAAACWWYLYSHSLNPPEHQLSPSNHNAELMCCRS